RSSHRVGTAADEGGTTDEGPDSTSGVDESGLDRPPGGRMCDTVVTTWADGGHTRYSPRHPAATEPHPRHCCRAAFRGTSAPTRKVRIMGVDLLLLTNDPDPASVLPALGLLSHTVRAHEPDVAALLEAGPYDAVLVDARVDLAGARS